MPPRVGLLAIGHPDYQNDISTHFASEAGDRLREQGVDVVFDGVAYTGAVAAGEAARELVKQDIHGVILWVGTWIECSTASAAVREFEHLPFAVWGFSMFAWEGKRESTGSFVAACVLKGAFDRMGYQYKFLIGLPEDEAVIARATAFCQAAHAVQRLKRTRLGLIGYAAMAMYPGTFDHVLLRRIVGPEIVQMDTYSLVRRMERIETAQADRVEQHLRDIADITVADDRLTKAARMAAALQEIASEQQLDAMNVKCQYELSQEFGMTACVPLSVLADSGIVSGCEGDAMVTATQCLLHYLSGQVVYYGDVLDLHGSQMLLSSCGFAPASLAHEKPCVCELGHPGFDGIICSFTLKRGPITFARLVEGRGDYRLNYGTGVGVETALRQGRFPALEVQLDGSPEKLMETMASQHFATCYGDYTEAIEDTCRALGIEAVRI